MRNLILCACFTLAPSCIALAQQPASIGKNAQGAPPKGAVAQPKLPDLLEGRVRAAWAAFRKRDKGTYAEFLTDDFQAVEADGEGERSKPRLLSEVERSVYSDYLLQLFQVQPLGRDFAFVTYESTMKFPTGAAPRYKRVFIGELWTIRDGQWKMMRYQETPVR
jgi:hypothetical protein